MKSSMGSADHIINTIKGIGDEEKKSDSVSNGGQEEYEKLAIP